MKKLLISICIIFIGCTSVFALANGFSIDTSNLSFTNSKKTSIVNNFNEEYNLSYSITSNDAEFEEQIINLSKKTTYLLLGKANNIDESSEEYYKRHQDYLGLRYNPEVPKDESTFTGLDEESQEYKDDLVSGITIPSMFLILDELGIVYSSIGDVRVSKTDDAVMSMVSLPNITIKEESKENPMEYETTKTNLILYYYFKELNGEYKLYYLMGETTDSLNDYFTEVESTEDKSVMQVAPSYDTSLSDIYDYSKLDVISDEQINEIYNNNSKNIVVLNSYYNNMNIASANGFFINDGLVITTWNFLEKSLIDAQYIAIKDSQGNNLSIDGIVTANPETDIAVIKLKDKTGTSVNLGNSDNLKTEDPAFVISSKTSVGLTIQKGIIVANDGYIQTAIPLSLSDEGSMLINVEGQVVGINTAKQINTSISIAVNANVLKEIQNKFANLDFNKLEAISFESLKEQYYYIKYNDEVVKNNIPENKWEEYSKIGNIKESINLELVKANYEDGIVSLRYQNGISKYISSMQLASQFKNNLLENGYNEVLNSSKKCIYEGKDYQIIIMEEFNYLIIVMVKLWWEKKVVY